MCNEFVGCVPCKTSTLNFLYVFNGYSVDLSKTFISWNHFKIYSQIKLTFCKIFCEQLWECDLTNHNLIIGGHAWVILTMMKKLHKNILKLLVVFF